MLLLSMMIVRPVFAAEPVTEAEGFGTNMAALQVELASLGEEVGRLQVALAARAQSEVAPPWGAAGFAEIDRRIERLAEYQERIAAGIETPAPSLDEPLVLFTVALCTGILGFLGGRIVGRRSRRDLRMRL